MRQWGGQRRQRRRKSEPGWMDGWMVGERAVALVVSSGAVEMACCCYSENAVAALTNGIHTEKEYPHSKGSYRKGP